MTDLLIKLFVKNPQNIKDNKVRENYGTLGSVVGIICNLLLCVLKITVGLLFGSISISADGLNNLSDMGSSVITMIGFKLANKPADSDHPFGHGRFEYISAIAVSILIFIVGIELFKTSVSSLVAGEKAPAYTLISIIILAVSVVMKLWMFLFNRKIGKKIDSEALVATAQDSVNDCIATTVILVSVGVSMFVKLPFNLDAVMGIAVSLFILYSGIGVAKDTLDQILGGPPEKWLVEELEQTIMSFEEFEGIHDLIVHNYGPGRQFASVHVEVPEDINIVKCHEKIDLCEKLCFEKLGLSLVIHMDPINTDDENISATKTAINEAVKTIDPSLTIHDFRMTPAGDSRTNLIFDVVLPAGSRHTEKELNEKIGLLAKQINPTFVCVITYDNDFSGYAK